jgi:photosystem II stability/assembly factor-like uncharacterized protein
VDPDGDDLEVIGLTSASPSPQPRPGRRGSRRRTVALAVAGVVLLGTVTAAGIALRVGSRHDRSRSSETIVLPAASPSTTANPLIPVPDAEFVGQMGLISPGVGWALNGYALYRTVDDGAHWSIITPPGTYDPIAHIYALDFLDADHAWAAVSLNSQPLRILRTADGGRLWTPILPNVCGTVLFVTALPCGSPVSIDFVDPQHGWALFSKPRSRGTLLATNDGGRTWTIVSRTPFSGALHFVDRDRGWAVTDPTDFFGIGPPGKPGGALYRTGDAGKTWQVVALPTAEAIGSLPLAVGAPQFLGHDDVVAARLVLKPANQRTIVVYSSHNSGATWTAHDAPSVIGVRFSDLDSYRFSAATASDWTLLVRSHLYATHDAGEHWTMLTPTTGRLVDVDFTTPSSGWLIAVAIAHACPDSPADRCTNFVLFRTTDGGTTWRPNSPTIGVTAERLP